MVGLNSWQIHMKCLPVTVTYLLALKTPNRTNSYVFSHHTNCQRVCVNKLYCIMVIGSILLYNLRCQTFGFAANPDF